MHLHDQHFLVVAAVEDRDAAALRQQQRSTPHKVMFQLVLAGSLERMHLDANGVHPRKNALQSPVLARRIHRLKNHQQPIAVVGVHHALQVVELVGVVGQDVLIIVLVFIEVVNLGVQLIELEFSVSVVAEVIGVYFFQF